MRKVSFNIIVIVLIAIIMIVLNEFNLAEQFSKFMLLPIIAFYFIGQYAERKFKS